MCAANAGPDASGLPSRLLNQLPVSEFARVFVPLRIAKIGQPLHPSVKLQFSACLAKRQNKSIECLLILRIVIQSNPARIDRKLALVGLQVE